MHVSLTGSYDGIDNYVDDDSGDADSDACDNDDDENNNNEYHTMIIIILLLSSSP
jgi:hypothetical protein